MLTAADPARTAAVMRFSTSPPPFPSLASALPEPVDEADESGVHPLGSMRPAESLRSTYRPGADDEDTRRRSLAPTIPPPDYEDEEELDLHQRMTPVDAVPAAERYREATTDPAPSSEEALQLVSEQDGEATRPAPPNEEAVALAKKLPSIPGLKRTSAPVSSGRRERQSLDALIDAMKRCFTEGDFEGAHRWATEILDRDSGHQGARNYLETCNRVLEQRMLGRIGDLSRVPVVLMTDDQVRWLALDHRAGFLLSMIDGFTSTEELLDIAGMPRNDVLRTLGQLIDQGVIGVR